MKGVHLHTLYCSNAPHLRGLGRGHPAAHRLPDSSASNASSMGVNVDRPWPAVLHAGHLVLHCQLWNIMRDYRYLRNRNLS